MVQLTGQFYEDAALVTPADPDEIRVIVRSPDNQVVTYVYPGSGSINRTSLGVYQFSVILDQSGRWFYRWEGAGAVNSADESEFWVRRSAVYGR
jgi:hypothetical protein